MPSLFGQGVFSADHHVTKITWLSSCLVVNISNFFIFSNFEWEKVQNPPSFYATTNGKRKGRAELNRVDFEKTKEQKCKNHVIAVQPISEPEPTCKPKTLSVLKFRPGNLAGKSLTYFTRVENDFTSISPRLNPKIENLT